MSLPNKISRDQFDTAMRTLGIDTSAVKALHITYSGIVAEEIVHDEFGHSLDGSSLVRSAFIPIVPRV